MAAPNRVLDVFHKLIGGSLIGFTVVAAGAFGYGIKSLFFDRKLHNAKLRAEAERAAAEAAATAALAAPAADGSDAKAPAGEQLK